MYIVNTATTEIVPVEILPLEERDFKGIGKRRYFFDWREEERYDVYKLVVEGKNDVLGLISLDFIDSESRVEIRLLATSKENRGSQKEYDRITGCLISFAARMAIKKYDNLPCVSLEPKTELRLHYKEKYYMKDGGRSVFCDELNLVRLSMEYE